MGNSAELSKQIRSLKEQLEILETKLAPEKVLWLKQSEEITNLCNKIEDRVQKNNF